MLVMTAFSNDSGFVESLDKVMSAVRSTALYKIIIFFNALMYKIPKG